MHMGLTRIGATKGQSRNYLKLQWHFTTRISIYTPLTRSLKLPHLPTQLIHSRQTNRFSAFFNFRENVGVDDRELRQDTAHRAGAADANAVAEEGGEDGRAGWTRGGVRGAEPEEVHRASDAPEPPDFQDASGEGGGGVRVLQPRSSCHTLRRVSLRTPSRPSFTTLRHLARGFPKTLPCRILCL
ncbi:hypothetical protein Fmac_022459 [Flemingia macrophylla]|uniref:Uncharacterized protein n=1 Tax=Flemingia macrophylla TaxID=520843 RepID=A0ABD1LZS1_9FABA